LFGWKRRFPELTVKSRDGLWFSKCKLH
jgi:hypothetical protein